MLNHITIMGRLTRDPELRRTGSGIPVASFTVAVDRDFSDKQSGEKETDFIDCVAWRQTGEFVSKHFSRGRMIVVSGRLQIRNWIDKDGGKRRTAEIVADNCYFGDSKPAGESAGGLTGFVPNHLAQPDIYPAPVASDYAMLEDDDAQLPF
jgi:single-strand DNA-binding protein